MSAIVKSVQDKARRKTLKTHIARADQAPLCGGGIQGEVGMLGDGLFHRAGLQEVQSHLGAQAGQAGGNGVMIETRTTDWFLTFTGKMFFPLEPSYMDVCIEDIAHSLAHQCRFAGHTQSFYSVAQHSVLVSENLPEELRFQGLMHDAPEAYCADLIRPIKYSIPGYREIEERIWTEIAFKYCLPCVLSRQVKAVDNRMLMTERRDLLVASGHEWSIAKEFPPFHEAIRPMTPVQSEDYFLAAFHRLFPKHMRATP